MFAPPAWILSLMLCLALTPRSAAPPAVSVAPAAPHAATGIEAPPALIEALVAREYQFASSEGGAWSAPNRMQNLRVKLQPTGVSYAPRTDEISPFQVTFSLAAWGRGSRVRAVPAGVLEGGASRTELRRDALGIREWFENRPEGLEQGFTLERPPGFAPAGEPLALRLAVGGAARAELDADARGVTLFDASDRRLLHWAGLHVEDATGRSLVARMRVREGVVDLLVDDQRARYPIVVDPIATNPSWSRFSSQAFAEFGRSAATAGDVNGDGYSDVIIGAPNYDLGQADQGAAFIYLGSANGLASSPVWTATYLEPFANFGFSVACAGDVDNDGYDDVVVGAPLADFDSGANCGAALLYRGDVNGPSTTATSFYFGGQANAQFGYCVNTAGDVNGDGFADVLVGSPLFTPSVALNTAGRAFLLLSTQSSVHPMWSQAWTFDGQVAGARYGLSVSTAGDVNADGYDDIIIGHPLYTNGQTAEGAFHVWLGTPGSGTLNLPFNYGEEGQQTQARMGISVANAGDVNGDGYADVIVGTQNWDGGSQPYEGKVRIYYGSSSGITGTGTTMEGNSPNDYFGSNVATAGDLNGDGYADVLVSWGNNNVVGVGGRCLAYLGSAVGITTTPIWTGNGTQQGDLFGFIVSTAGDVNGDGFSDILTTAYKWDINTQFTDAGAAYVYLGGASMPDATAPAPTWFGSQAGGAFGTSVAGVGDYNGDGYEDVVVGEPQWDAPGSPGSDAGRVMLFLGSTSGLSGSPASIYTSGFTSTDREGDAVAGGGDLNGDGYADIADGLPGHFGVGGVLFHFGNPSGSLSGLPIERVFGDGVFGQAGEGFGTSLACNGDLNGDGISDLVVGAPYWDGPLGLDQGRVCIWLGRVGANGFDNRAPDQIRVGGQRGENFGYCVAIAPDLNRDGRSDLIVGAPAHQVPAGPFFTFSGRVAAYLGTSAGVQASPWHDVIGGGTDELGRSVASAGDVNGDGFSDFIAGAYVNAGQNGAAFLYLGGASGVSGTVPIASPQGAARFGWTVAGVGDIDADGYSDFAVGASLYDGDYAVDEGRLCVYRGKANPVYGQPDWYKDGGQAGSGWSASISSTDVNSDGFTDIIGSAPAYSGGLSGQGYVQTYLGNRGGVPRRSRMYTPGFAADVIPMCGSGSPDGLSAISTVRSAAGRTRVALQSRIGRADGPALASEFLTPWVLSGPPSGIYGSYWNEFQTIDHLAGQAPYSWRVRYRAKTPFFPRTPWFDYGHNGADVFDFRTLPATTAVEPTAVTGLEFAPPSPNPMRDATTFRFALPSAAHARLDVLDVQGRVVRTLADSPHAAGWHRVSWDGRDAGGSAAAAGVYFVRLDVAGEHRTQRVARVN